MAHVIFIHGLDNKPEANYLHKLWLRKLAHDDGVDLDSNGVTSSMAYWADVLYESPDVNLAAYELATGQIEGIDSTVAENAIDTSVLPLAEAAKMRALANRLGVDLDANGEMLPGEEAIAAVRLERIPMPDWLRQRVMKKVVRDLFLYNYDQEYSPRSGESYKVRDELRSRFLERLKEAEGKGPIVVLSHSMGTIIAYDCLKHIDECPRIQGLITVGSPLGMDEVQAFFPGWSRDDGFPSEKLDGPWVNVYDPLDVVAGFDPKLANDYRQGGTAVIEDVRQDNWGTWRHSISKYLQGKLMRGNIAKLVSVDWS
jgi:pimeloyl-ACP methyl ester carboxylesterase